MDASDTHAKIKAGLHEHQRSVLAALDYYDGHANKQQIRQFAANFRSTGAIPEGSVYHHFTAVEDEDLAEKTGQESVGRGGNADVYELTPLGQTIAPDCREDDTITVDDVVTLIDRVNEHGKSIDSIEEDVREMKESYAEIQRSLAQVSAHLGIKDDEEDDGEDDTSETIGRL